MSLRQLRRCVSPERHQLLPKRLLARSSLFIHSSPDGSGQTSVMLLHCLVCCTERAAVVPRLARSVHGRLLRRSTSV